MNNTLNARITELLAKEFTTLAHYSSVMKRNAINPSAVIQRRQGEGSNERQIQCYSDPIRADTLWLLKGQQGLMIGSLESLHHTHEMILSPEE